ncbi:MAG: hypothetical protein ACKO50_04505 [Cyanobium sp.]
MASMRSQSSGNRAGAAATAPGVLAALALGLAAVPQPAWAGAAARFPRSPAAAYGYAEIHPAWLQGGFWRGRPWPSGWYQTSPSAWAREGMASGHTITLAVNEALALQSPSIVVPNTGYQLNFASVEALPNSRILFFYGTGAASKRGVGECQIGLLNGKAAAGDEALVLNAACIVAYGRGV